MLQEATPHSESVFRPLSTLSGSSLLDFLHLPPIYPSLVILGLSGSGGQKSFSSFLCHRHNLGLHDFSSVLPFLSTNCIGGGA